MADLHRALDEEQPHDWTALEAEMVTGHRGVRGLMYGCLTGAGASLWFLHIAFLADVTGLTYLGVSVFLFVGGLVSGVGHGLRILVVERAGYPLVLASLSVLAVVLFNGSGESAVRLFNGLIIFGFTLGLYGRWRDLGTLLKAQRASARGASDGR
jgi:hypothetical protein